MPIMHSTGCQDSPQSIMEENSRHKSSCFFCNEPTPAVSVSSSLLESIMKIKSYMCIPLQLKDLPVTAIFLCPKCLDIVSQIEGWIDLMRQRIFDAHEGAILYPETPLWLQALSSGPNARAKEVEVVAAVPPVAEEVVLGPAVSLPYTPEAASPPQPASAVHAGAKRKPSGGVAVSSVPPKKIAAAAAAAASGHGVTPSVTSPSPPCTSAAVRSAIDSLTTIMNVVQQGSPQKALTSSTEPALPPPPASLDVTAAAAASVAADLVPKTETTTSNETFIVKLEPSSGVPHDKAKDPPNPFDMIKRWCSICCSSYHNDSVFKRHIVSIHPELCHKCELCGQLFATAHSRAVHVTHGCCERSSNRTRVLHCTDCHASFLGKYELKRHVLLTGHMGGVSGGHSL